MLKLLKHVVGWPVTGPSFLLGFTMRQLQGTALREVSDDTAVREELLELQLLLELGEIDEEAYLEREAELMLRLREVREWKSRLGLPGVGGPLFFEGADVAGGPEGGGPEGPDEAGRPEEPTSTA